MSYTSSYNPYTCYTMRRINREWEDVSQEELAKSRQHWLARRQRMESARYQPKRVTSNPLKLFNGFLVAANLFEFGLKCFNLEKRGMQNACAFQVRHVELSLKSLPAAFDGYQIMHLSDFHVEFQPKLISPLCAALNKESVDLCILTGDYQDKHTTHLDKIIMPMQAILKNIHTRDGIVAVLGNHDTSRLVEPLEQRGVTVLINESVALKRGNDAIILTGLDDVHYFHSADAYKALKQTPQGFKIALVHSPEYHKNAEKHGYALYLSGHTHGGQICAPCGTPIVTCSNTPRSMTKGLWSYKKLTGYTTAGTGVVGLPFRFNCPPEILIYTLRNS